MQNHPPQMQLKLRQNQSINQSINRIKSVEATGVLRGNKSANNFIKVSRTTQEDLSKAVANEAENIELYRKIPKEGYVSLEDRQKNVEDLR